MSRAAREGEGVSEQWKASLHRLEDARVLLGGRRWRGAMYLAGYSVESLLKFKLMNRYNCSTLTKLEAELGRRSGISAKPDLFIHSLESLLRLTGARDRMFRSGDPWRRFLLVNRWVPAWRYSGEPSDERRASQFLEAVEVVRSWVNSNV